MRSLLKRLRYWTSRRRQEAELAEELETHRALRQEQLERDGLSRDDACYASRRALGNDTLARERAREVWVFRWLDELGQDVRYGLRALRRTPTFTAVAVLTLALAIGANSSVFAVLDALLLQRLPVAQPRQLFALSALSARGADDTFSYESFTGFREGARGAASIFAATNTQKALVFVDGAPETLFRKSVSGDYFDVLGVPSSIGRTFTAEDDRLPPGEPVAVLSHAYWRRRFAGDPNVVGRSFQYQGSVFTIVGVAARAFFGEAVGEAPDVWTPLTVQPGAPAHLWRGDSITWLRILGRLEAPEAEAHARLQQSFERLRADRLGRAQSDKEREGLRETRLLVEDASRGVSPLRRVFRTPLRIVMAIVLTSLLIACANLANLLLERGQARQRELAVRLAIGARGGRLVRQLLTEALLLALLGGALGLLVARWGMRALVAVLPSPRGPVALTTALDGRVLAFTAALSLLTAIAFGILPALRATRLGHAFAAPSALSPRGPAARARLAPALVASQLALSLALATGAGLLVRSLDSLLRVELGFEPDPVLVFRIVRTTTAPEREQAPLFKSLLERAEAHPEVQAASQSFLGLFGDGSWGNRIAVPGYSPAPGETVRTYANAVSARYFQVLGVPLVRGRSFTAQDVAGARPVVIVNQAFAARFFGAGDPIGRRVGLGEAPTPSQMLEVVGVVRDGRYQSIREQQRTMLYVPAAQYSGSMGELQLRPRADPGASAARLLRELGAAVPGLRLVEVHPLRARVNASIAPERLIAGVAALFSALALALAAIGLYGVLSYAVSRRRHEIGIRIALGAHPGDVVRLVLRQTARVVAAGLLLGLPAAWLASRLLSSLLHGVGPGDPLAFGGAALLLVAAAALAAWLPARRAASVDPMLALRCE